MNDEFRAILDGLIDLRGQIRQGLAGGAERLWRGADVVIAEEPPEPSGGGFFPEPRAVVTPYAHQLSGLFESLRDLFSPVLDGNTKIEFYGRLANAANRFIAAHGNDDLRGLLEAVVEEAARILDEMSNGTFGYLSIAPGGLIWDDIVNAAADRLQLDHPGLVVGEDARRVLLDRVDQHREAVDAELREGRATPESLRHAAYQQLLESMPPALDLTAILSDRVVGGRSRTIRGQDVEASMRRACWYIPWC